MPTNLECKAVATQIRHRESTPMITISAGPLFTLMLTNVMCTDECLMMLLNKYFVALSLKLRVLYSFLVFIMKRLIMKYNVQLRQKNVV